jgi:Coenzyme PQQ synthesis protein D (PqqD)
MELQVDTLIRATSDHLAAHLEGGSFVLELGSGTYYRLNEVAGRAWQLLREPTTITAMSEQISREYDVDEVTCVTDLLALGRQLADEGLITTVDE